MVRYLGVASGPFGAAGVQFLLSLMLLRVLEPADFGAFSLLFLLSQLLLLMWSALFCAPIILSMPTTNDEPAIDAIMAANMMASLACGAAMLAGAIWLGLSLSSAIEFALYTSLSLLRWLGRSVCYARSAAMRVMLSDHGYTLVLLVATGWIALSPRPTLELACLGLAGAMLFALAAVGGGFARMQLRALHPRRLPQALHHYRHIWRAQGSWSLAGSVAAEFMGNNQAFLVTAMLGPRAFAPLAASFLLVRPIPIAITAMVEYERARMASVIGRGMPGALPSLLRGFTAAMLAVWAATGVLAAVLLGAAPGLIFPSHYALPLLATGTALWMAVLLPRCLRAPAATALQAAGEFRPLAIAGAVGSVVSLVAVAGCLWLAPPVWTLLGTLAGELAATLLIWRSLAGRSRRLVAQALG